jgi:hypothetical protein
MWKKARKKEKSCRLNEESIGEDQLHTVSTDF